MGGAARLLALLGVAIGPTMGWSAGLEDPIAAALDYQLNGITRLEELAARARASHPAKVTPYLERLVDALDRAAVLEFQRAYHVANGGAVDLARFKALEHKMVDATTSLLAESAVAAQPGKRARLLFLRGKGYRELGVSTAAIRDYKVIVFDLPNATETIPAGLALVGMLREEKDFPGALAALGKLALPLTDPAYPTSLSHAAWCHYHLNRMAEAIDGVEKVLAYWSGANAKGRGKAEATEAREAAALFYATALEKKTLNGGVARALQVLGAHGGWTDNAGKAMAGFAYHLAAKGLEEDLDALLQAALAEKSIPPVTRRDVVLAAFEHYLNKRDHARIDRALSWIQPDTDRAQRLLTSAATELQGDLGRAVSAGQPQSPSAGQAVATSSGEAPAVARLSPLLVRIYGVLLSLPGVPALDKSRYHNNLAQAAALGGDLKLAARHYRQALLAGAGAPWAKEAGLRAIAAMYDAFKKQGAIPSTLEVRPLGGGAVVAGPPRDPVLAAELSDWGVWVRDYPKPPSKPFDPAIELYVFEVNRLAYFQGRVQDAVDGMLGLVRADPASPNAAAAASLVLDTYVAGSKWNLAYPFTQELLKVTTWKDPAFAQRLHGIAADCIFRSMELDYAAGSHASVIARADQFLRTYPGNPRTEDVLAMAAGSSLALGQKQVASNYYAKMNPGTLSPDRKATATLTRAAVAEDRMDYAVASGEFASYLALRSTGGREPASASTELGTLRTKTLFYAWLSGDRGVLDRALRQPAVCGAGAADLCRDYGERLMWMEPRPARSAASTSSPLLAALEALEGLGSVSPKIALDRLKAWDEAWKGQKLDPLLAYSALPSVLRTLPGALRVAREQAAVSGGKLRASKESIGKRVAAVQAFEETASRFAQSDWARVRVAADFELAQAYLALSADLAALPAPKGLGKEEIEAYRKTIDDARQPFEGKGRAFLERAFAAATDAPLEAAALEEVRRAHFAKNAASAQSLRASWTAEAPLSLHASLIGALTEGVSAGVKGQWEDALRSRNWPKLAHLVQSTKAPLGQVVGLSAVGAQAEALVELEKALPELGGVPRGNACAALISHYYFGQSRERLRPALETCKSSTPAAYQGLVAQATAWAYPPKGGEQ